MTREWRVDLLALAEAVERRCILRDREYELSSGRKTNYYYDGKRALLAADMKVELAKAMLGLAEGLDYSLIGGVPVGSVLLAEQMSMLTALTPGATPIDTFFVRDTRKDHGTQERVYLPYDGEARPILRPGARVLIVDDVITTGRSLQEALRELDALEVEIAGVAVVVDRLDPEAGELRRGSKFPFRALFEADQMGYLTPAAVADTA